MQTTFNSYFNLGHIVLKPIWLTSPITPANMMNMFISMMVVNPQLLVAGEKKDKKEDDIDMSDGK